MKTVAQGGTAIENATRMFIGHVKHTLTFKNQTNMAGKVTLYDITIKRNPVGTAVDIPTELWDKGFTDMSVTTQRSNVGATPFRSEEFRTYCRVRRVTVIPLEPGQQHVHTVIQRVNRVIDSTVWANVTSGLSSIAGLTSFILMSFHGGLAHDTTATTSVTYAPIRLDWVSQREFHFGFIQQNRPSYSLTDTVPTGLANLDFMGENQDADVDPIDA